jgi:Tol biopolymer transport system component
MHAHSTLSRVLQREALTALVIAAAVALLGLVFPGLMTLAFDATWRYWYVTVAVLAALGLAVLVGTLWVGTSATHVVQGVLVALALLALGAGSALLAATWLDFGTSGDTLDVRGFGLLIFWPPTVLGLLVFGLLALLIGGRSVAILPYMAGVGALLLGGWLALGMTIGLPGIAGALLLVALNVAAFVWLRPWLMRRAPVGAESVRRMRKRRLVMWRLTLTLVFAFLSLLLTACGGSDRAALPATAPATPAIAPSSIAPTAQPTMRPSPTPRPAAGQLLVAGIFGDELAGYRAYIVNNDGSGVRPVATGGRGKEQGRETFPVWSPDGNQIAFASERLGMPILAIVTADGRVVRELVTGGPARELAWSPDGLRIAMVVRDKHGDSIVEVVRADGSGKLWLVRGGGDVELMTPQWSPDSRSIAYALWPNEGHPDIYVMDLIGAPARQLTTSTGRNSDPAWSPDGSLLAFMSFQDDRTALYITRVDGSGARALDLPSEPDGPLAWSPDGRLIAVGAAGDLFAVAVDGSGARQLTDTDLWREIAPAWSPDGAQIAYLRAPVDAQAGDAAAGRFELLVMDADGSNPRNVLSGIDMDESALARPAWRPLPERAAVPGTPTPQPAPTPITTADLRSAVPTPAQVAEILGGRFGELEAGPGRLGQEFEGVRGFTDSYGAIYASREQPGLVVAIGLALFETELGAREYGFLWEMDIPQFTAFAAGDVGEDRQGYVLTPAGPDVEVHMTWLVLRVDRVVASIWIMRRDDVDMRADISAIGARVAAGLEMLPGGAP